MKAKILFILIYLLTMTVQATTAAKFKAQVATAFKNAAYLHNNVASIQSGKSNSKSIAVTQINKLVETYGVDVFADGILNSIHFKIKTLSYYDLQSAAHLLNAINSPNVYTHQLVRVYVQHYLVNNSLYKNEDVNSFIHKLNITPDTYIEAFEIILNSDKNPIKSIGQIILPNIKQVLGKYKFLERIQDEYNNSHLSLRQMRDLTLSFLVLNQLTESIIPYQTLAAKILTLSPSHDRLERERLYSLKGLTSYLLYKSTYVDALLNPAAINRNSLPKEVQAIIKNNTTEAWEFSLNGTTAKIYKSSLLNTNTTNADITSRKYETNKQIKEIKRFFITQRPVSEVIDWLYEQKKIYPETVNQLHQSMFAKHELVLVLSNLAFDTSYSGLTKKLFGYSVVELTDLSPSGIKKLSQKHISKNEYSHAVFLISFAIKRLNRDTAKNHLRATSLYYEFSDILKKWLFFDIIDANNTELSLKRFALRLSQELGVIPRELLDDARQTRRKVYEAQSLLERSENISMIYHSLGFFEKIEEEKSGGFNPFFGFKIIEPQLCSSLFK